MWVHMKTKTAAEEFEFLTGKLERIARLLVQLDHNSVTEAAFMIGCLHNICCQNAVIFKDKVEL